MSAVNSFSRCRPRTIGTGNGPRVVSNIRRLVGHQHHRHVAHGEPGEVELLDHAERDGEFLLVQPAARGLRVRDLADVGLAGERLAHDGVDRAGVHDRRGVHVVDADRNPDQVEAVHVEVRGVRFAEGGPGVRIDVAHRREEIHEPRHQAVAVAHRVRRVVVGRGEVVPEDRALRERPLDLRPLRRPLLEAARPLEHVPGRLEVPPGEQDPPIERQAPRVVLEVGRREALEVALDLEVVPALETVFRVEAAGGRRHAHHLGRQDEHVHARRHRAGGRREDEDKRRPSTGYFSAFRASSPERPALLAASIVASASSSLWSTFLP